MNKTNACLCHEAPLASCSLGLGAVAGQRLFWDHLEKTEGWPGDIKVGISGSEALWVQKWGEQAGAASLADRMEMLLP